MKTCPYCKEEFETKREWQVTCAKQACMDKHRVEVTKQWRKDNPLYHKLYMTSYCRVVSTGAK